VRSGVDAKRRENHPHGTCVRVAAGRHGGPDGRRLSQPGGTMPPGETDTMGELAMPGVGFAGSLRPGVVSGEAWRASGAAREV